MRQLGEEGHTSGAQVSLMTLHLDIVRDKLQVIHGMLEIKPGLSMCKASVLPASYHSYPMMMQT